MPAARPLQDTPTKLATAAAPAAREMAGPEGARDPGRAGQARRLQRSIGNRATARLLSRRAGDDVTMSDTATETEADHIAEGRLLPPAGLGGDDVAALGAARRRQPLPPDLDAALAGPGRALDPGVQARFEDQLGVPLSDVRVHTGRAADSSAAARGARAYTFGSDLVFRNQDYAPQTGPGQALLGHELAHVAQQAATGRPVLARKTPDVQPQFDAARLPEWERDPPDAKMSVSLDGITLRPVDGQFFVMPDPQRAPSAVVLKRLVGASYDKALIDKFVADWMGTPWKPAGPRVVGIYLNPLFARTVIETIEGEFKLKAGLDPQQRSLLAAGESLNPVPEEIWQDVAARDGTPLPGQGPKHFLAKRRGVLNRLAALWWDRTLAYSDAYHAWNDNKTPETQTAAGGAFLDLIKNFEIYEETLRTIYGDKELAKTPVWQTIWPTRKGKPPTLTEFNENEAALFVQYAATQTAELLTNAQGDPALRHSLLMGFASYRGEQKSGDGDQQVSSEPSRYNAGPLPVNMSAYPQPEAPGFSVSAGATTTFTTSVGFLNNYEALSNAFAGWFYNWSVARVPGDDVKNLTGFDKLPKWTPTGVDVLKQNLGRDLDNAVEDQQHVESISTLSSVLGPPGMNAQTLVGLNLLMDIAGSFLKALFTALTQPQNEYSVPFKDPGLYVVMCYVGPRLDDTAKYVQFRRMPSIAWLPVYAKQPKQVAIERSQFEFAGRAEAEKQLASMQKLMAGDPAINDLTKEERDNLPTEVARLKLGLYGSTLEILQGQLADLTAQQKRFESHTTTAADAGTDLSAVEASLKDVKHRIEMRQERAAKLGNRPYHLPSVLAPDEGPVKVLTIEAAQVGTPDPGEAPTWYVSDLTSDRSEQKEAAGNGKVVPGHPVEDSIMTAMRLLLENSSEYARGYLSVTFPPELGLAGEPARILTIRIAQGPAKIAVHAAESLSTLLSIAAVVAAPFTAGASLALLMPAGIIGALPSAYRLVHRYEMGTFRLDLETATDIVNIAASLVSLGEAGAGARAVVKAGTRAGLRYAVVEGTLWITGLGLNGFGMLLMGAGLVEQIQATAGLPPGLRAARIAEIMGNAMLQIGIQAGAHFASSHYLKGVESGVRGVEGGQAPGVRQVLDPDIAKLGRPGGRAEPPPALENALPADLRRSTPLDVDPKLKGGTVRVEYGIGENGRVEAGSIRIVAGANATPHDIAMHVETARTLQAYAGLLGAVHEGIQKIKGVLGKRAPEQGSPVWEAQLEMAKLDSILRDRLKTVSKQTVEDDRVGELATDIANLHEQLLEAQRTLAGIDVPEAKGYIAADSPAQRQAKNRKVMADKNIGKIVIHDGRVSIEPAPTAGSGPDPVPGYSFQDRQNGPVPVRVKDAGDAPKVIRLEHGGRVYVAPAVPEGATIGEATHRNNIAAQLDGYPPPNKNHHWTPDPAGGWQLERDVGYNGPTQRIAKSDGKPVQAEQGGFTFNDRPARLSFEDRQRSGAAAQPLPESRSQALETELNTRNVSSADNERGILRRWSGTLRELGVIAGESLGLNVPGEGEVAKRAVEALSSQLGPNGTYSETRYNAFRYAVRDAAVATIFGFDPREVGAFVDNGQKLPHVPRSAAEQKLLYDRLYAALPDSASRGELWNSYREIRGRLSAEQGGFGDFERLEIKTIVLETDPETRIDGGVRVAPNVQKAGAPGPGEHAVESKGGDSFSNEQSKRYSDNLKRNGNQLKGDNGAVYEGVVYMYDNFTAADRVARSLDKNGRHGNLFVGYVDSAGNVRWIAREIKPVAKVAVPAVAPPVVAVPKATGP